MSELTDADIEKELEIELSAINETETDNDDINNIDDDDGQNVDDVNISDDVEGEDPPELRDISTAFADYFTSLEENINKEFEEFNAENQEYESFLNECLSRQGTNRDDYVKYVQDMKEDLDKVDPEFEQILQRRSVMASRTASRSEVTSRTQSRNTAENEANNNDTDITNPDTSQMAIFKNNEDSDDMIEDPTEVNIINAWIETDKEIERINEERWNEYTTFMNEMGISNSEANGRQAKIEKEIEEAKEKQKKYKDKSDEEERLLASQHAVELETHQVRMERYTLELEEERKEFAKLKKEIERRELETKTNAAITIQKYFRGSMIRIRIGDDIAALREKARFKYRKEQIVKQEKLAQKQKAKELAKVRHQRELEASRTSTRQSLAAELDSFPQTSRPMSGTRKKSESEVKKKRNVKNIKKSPEKKAIHNNAGQLKIEELHESTMTEVPVNNDDIDDKIVISSSESKEVNSLKMDAAVELEGSLLSESIVPMCKVTEPISTEISGLEINAINESFKEVVLSNNANDTSKLHTNNGDESHSDVISMPPKSDTISNSSPNKSMYKKTAYVTPIQKESIVNEKENNILTIEDKDPVFKNSMEISNSNKSSENLELNRDTVILKSTNVFSSEQNSNEAELEENNSIATKLCNEFGDQPDDGFSVIETKSINFGENNSAIIIEEEFKKVSYDIELELENRITPENNSVMNGNELLINPKAECATENTTNQKIPESTATISENINQINTNTESITENPDHQTQNESNAPDSTLAIFENTIKESKSVIQPNNPHLRDLWTSWKRNTENQLLPVSNQIPRQVKQRRPKSSAIKKLQPLSSELIYKYSQIKESLNTLNTLTLLDIPDKFSVNCLGDLCPCLEVININRCHLKVLEGLEKCLQLKYLNVKENQIEFINLAGGSTKNSSLIHLDLSHNQLTTLHGIESCTVLRSLVISYNNISKLSADSLHGCASALQMLDASHNQIFATPGLALCSRLHFIDLAMNNISEFLEIQHLDSLCWLNLSGNSLTKLPSLINTPMLQHLIISQNNIASLEPLNTSDDFWLPNLRELNLSANNLIEFKPFVFPLLASLDLSNNPLADLFALMEQLKQYPFLEKLSLIGTPCLASQSAESTIEGSLSNLVYLNDKPINDRFPTKTIFNDDAFLDICVKFGVSWTRFVKKFNDKIKLSDSANLPQVYKRHYDDLESLLRNHKQFQTTGDVSQLQGKKRKKLDGTSSDTAKTDPETSEPCNNRTVNLMQLSEDAAATKIAAFYKGYRVRKAMIEEIDELFCRSAVRIQAVWRGYHVRNWIRKALEQVRLNEERNDSLSDVDAEDDMLPIDLSEFNEDNVDKLWNDICLPPTPKPVFRPPPQKHQKPPINHSVSIFNTNCYEQSNPRPTAWVTEKPIRIAEQEVVKRPPSSASSKARTETIFDMDSYRRSSLSNQIPPSIISDKMSKKKDAIMNDWGFQNDSVATAMLQRAKKLKYNSERKKKLSQMDPKARLQLIRKFESERPAQVSVRVTTKTQPILPQSGRMEYFRTKALQRLQLEAKNQEQSATRTYEWVFSQPVQGFDTSVNNKSIASTGGQSATKLKSFLPMIHQDDGGWLVTQAMSSNSNTRAIKKQKRASVHTH